MSSQGHSRMAGRLQGRIPITTSARALAATLFYCTCSMAMMYTNKYVLSVYKFVYPSVVLSYQCVLAVVILKCLGLAGVVKVDAIEGHRMRKWMPATLLFLAMVTADLSTNPS
eukprot:Opistho-2@20465